MEFLPSKNARRKNKYILVHSLKGISGEANLEAEEN